MKFVKAVCLLGCCYGVFMNIALQKHDRLSAFIFLSCSIVLGGISFFESNRYWNRLRDLRSGTQSTEAVEVLYIGLRSSNFYCYANFGFCGLVLWQV